MRDELDIGGPWRFLPDPYREGLKAGFAAAGYDDRRWREVRVPCGFEACGPGLETYEGAAWFRRAVDVPAEWQRRRVVLRFEGVNHHARVWVNGRAAGENGDAFLPFELPVADALRCGQSNTIAVLVDNERRPGEIPAGLVGWRSCGGILREVRLVATSAFRIADVTIAAEPAAGGGTFALRASVANDRPLPCPATLSADVADAGGKVLAGFTTIAADVPVGQAARLEMRGSVPGVQPWSPQHPHLYTARLTLGSSDGPADRLDVRFGFRRIETQGARLLLNGQAVFLTGFNRHEDSPRTGMASDLPQVRADLG
jgi:beta-galactosidase/beta-glucuronidase